MKYILTFMLAAVSLSACGPQQRIEVREAWTRPAAQGENGAVYFAIHNQGLQDDALTGVTSDVAEAVEMHESTMSGDVMQMQKLDSVPLERSAEIKFAPGGLHIMLVSLKRDLHLGDEIEITLHFTNFEDISVIVPVSDMPALGEHSASGH